MPRHIRIKMCGLTRPQDVAAAVAAGAAYVGFTFFEKSPRFIGLEDARRLALEVPEGVARVALTVDADDATLDALTERVPLDMLQLHGSESAARVRDIKARYGLPVMKAVGIADASDLPRIDVYEGVADQILLDTKPPRGADRPGGNAEAFDWDLIAGRRWASPWMLAGGLTRDNVLDAIRATGALQLDLSSGIESAPGVKDATLMAEFAEAARA